MSRCSSIGWIIHLAGACAVCQPTVAAQQIDPMHQWGQWRGPLATGVAPHGSPPATWSENSNIRWKSALPGLGHSSPVVWGDRVFVTSAIATGEKLGPVQRHVDGAHDNMDAARAMEFVVMAFARDDGRVLWRQTVHSERPHESTHESGSWASHSPVTDGAHVIASFGSRGAFGLDTDGAILWQADIGNMQTKHSHGEGSSPVLHGEIVAVNWDHEGESFIIALDKRSGERQWKAARDEGTSWSTPIVVEHEDVPQLIVAATNRVRGYDLSTGDVIWECGGLSGNVVASPVAADGVVYVGSSYEKQVLFAIRLDAARGDITGTDAVIWKRDQHTPYVPSPLLYDDKLYFLRHYQGIITCVDATTGKSVYGPERIPGIHDVYASLVGADGRVYVASRNGATAVLKHGSEFELLALNRLEDSFSASPAVVRDELYLRGAQYLYCIASSAGK